jgi:hypothetical protein
VNYRSSDPENDNARGSCPSQPKSACHALVGLLTPERPPQPAFSIAEAINGHYRMLRGTCSVTAAGPFRIRTGFPVCRRPENRAADHQRTL